MKRITTEPRKNISKPNNPVSNGAAAQAGPSMHYKFKPVRSAPPVVKPTAMIPPTQIPLAPTIPKPKPSDNWERWKAEVLPNVELLRATLKEVFDPLNREPKNAKELEDKMFELQAKRSNKVDAAMSKNPSFF